SSAWSVEFTAGSDVVGAKSSPGYVRAVRDGSAPTVLGQPIRTGQTSCYDAPGAAISCAGTGQDGELQTGLAPAYVDNDDGTITDIGTGLMWEKLSGTTGIHQMSGRYQWSEAFGKIASLNNSSFAGYGDWRLPDITELQSLASYTGADPAIDM